MSDIIMHVNYGETDFGRFGKNSIEDIFKIAADIGYDGIEFRSSIPQELSHLSYESYIDEIGRCKGKYGLKTIILSARYGDLLSKSNEECAIITKKAKEEGVKIIVCTVLRYTPLFTKLKDIIDSGKIGDIMSINHEECVGNVHQSHSFVRGNWGNSERSSCMLLQKSCHDTDILQWLIGKNVLRCNLWVNFLISQEKMPLQALRITA